MTPHLRLLASPRVCMVLAACLLAGSWTLAKAWAVDGTHPDLMTIVKDELNREFNELKQKGDPPPYYMAYEVSDEHSTIVSANLGALVNDSQTHVRGFDTTIRIGSPAFDNYHPYKDSRVQFTRFTQIALDDDPNEIRRALWTETDRVYRSASRRLLQLKTDQQLLAEDKEKDADFSVDPAVTYAHAPEQFSIDKETWAKKVRVWSAEFKSHDKILGSGVDFVARRNLRTFVNTEGSAIQTGSNLFRIEMQAEALAAGWHGCGGF